MIRMQPNQGHAVEYLRRSVERDKGADKDKGAGQRAANAAQAASDGVIIAKTFDGDWGISGGRGKRDKRTAMAELIDAIKAGQVSRVYCHTADRLARDAELGLQLWNACADHGTIIRAGGQTFDPTQPGNLTVWSVLMAQAQEDLERITLKNQDAQDFGRDHAATCKLPGRPHKGRCHLVGCTDTSHCRYAHERGRKAYGDAPGEDAAKVLAAFDAVGSFLGTAKRLNADGVPTRFGGRWDTSSVSKIVRRLRPNMPAIESSGRGWRATAPRIFTGLLVCDCGHVMTSMGRGPSPSSRQRAYTVGYLCRQALHNPSHLHPYFLAESKVLGWAKAELADVSALQTTRKAVAPIPSDEVSPERRALNDKRVRTLDMYAEGLLEKSERDKRLAAIKDSLAALARERELTVYGTAPLDWTTVPGELNSQLRSLWQAIKLRHRAGKRGKPATFEPYDAVWQPGAKRWAKGFDVKLTDGEIAAVGPGGWRPSSWPADTDSDPTPHSDDEPLPF